MIQLTKREKRLLIILASVMAIAIAYYLIITPVIKFKKNADNTLENNIKKINKLDDLYAEYKQIQSDKNRLNLDSNSRSVSSIVEEAAESLNITTNKVNLDEKPGIVKDNIQLFTTEIKFEGVSIKNIIDLIFRIESSGAPLKIKNLTITSGIKGKNRYDVLITIVSLAKR